ncbi:MAG: 4-hydroxy-3-methylbut-2-enyl diphosphate reductase [Desulfovibrio sp.]|jgi:4-hydroxy-3-methylbut-2-enyl diphosphate reductase|nr:4-hydroxy-3-methylbut-2-enyl diphosphate reductase [Desulfovibrio sp.]
MRVMRAESAGFCLGVSLALQRLEREQALSGERGGRLITLGPVIHNPLLMSHYTQSGVICDDAPHDLRPEDRVLIRAHGIPRDVEAALKESGVSIADATCPKVKKARSAIGKAHAAGGVLLLLGERDHPEVRGLLSYAGPSAQVFADLEELRSQPLDPETDYFLAAQTTQSRAIFNLAVDDTARRLRREVPALDTICDATSARQQEVSELCATVASMVVVGGFNSGNTKRLAETAAEAGVFAVHVERPSDFSQEDLRRIRSAGSPVGLSAGASTPVEQIDAVQNFLEQMDITRNFPEAPAPPAREGKKTVCKR